MCIRDSVYTALHGGPIMRKWTNDGRMMIICRNDSTRPFIFKIERIDIPEYEEEKLWLEKQNFKNMADDAYTSWQLQAYQYDKIGNYFERI